MISTLQILEVLFSIPLVGAGLFLWVTLLMKVCTKILTKFELEVPQVAGKEPDYRRIHRDMPHD